MLFSTRSYIHDTCPGSNKHVEIRFLMNPICLEPNDSNRKQVGSVVCERAKLEGEPFHQKSVGTNKTETMPADLVLVSIGYKGMPLEGMNELEVFDDDRGIVLNVNGKVAGDNNMFVTGWIKRAPTGKESLPNFVLVHTIFFFACLLSLQ